MAGLLVIAQVIIISAFFFFFFDWSGEVGRAKEIGPVYLWVTLEFVLTGLS